MHQKVLYAHVISFDPHFIFTCNITFILQIKNLRFGDKSNLPGTTLQAVVDLGMEHRSRGS